MIKRELEKVSKPNLFKGIFPYDLPPKTVFENKKVDLEGTISERNLRISDTTFRDGQQARPPYTVMQIVDLFNLLNKISGPNGILIDSEFFVYSKKDKDAVIACSEQGHKYPKVTGWIRGTRHDSSRLKWLADNNIKETGLLTSSSDYHIFLKLKKDRKKIFDEYISMVEKTVEKGIRPRCHLEDITRADIYGFVVPFVQKLMEISDQLEENLKVKIRLCDTLGFGVPHEKVTLPRSIPKLVHTIRYEAGVPSERLEWHGHNDFGKVHANATSAWLYGCDILNTTLCGFGERTGNPPLEAAIFEYMSLKGTKDGMDTKTITEAADYFRSIGVTVPSDKPIVGDGAFSTSAGIHAAGIEDDLRIYNPYNTKKLLDRDPEILLTDKSGPEGVIAYVNQYLRSQVLLGKAEEVPLTHVLPICNWWKREYSGGRNTAISPEEMEEQMREHLPQYFGKQKTVHNP
jgi:isopropylmalate/homocitrate/citramalate synthase